MLEITSDLQVRREARRVHRACRKSHQVEANGFECGNRRGQASPNGVTLCCDGMKQVMAFRVTFGARRSLGVNQVALGPAQPLGIARQ